MWITGGGAARLLARVRTNMLSSAKTTRKTKTQKIRGATTGCSSKIKKFSEAQHGNSIKRT